MTAQLPWTELGHALRESAMDAHDGILPELDLAYCFLLENPTCFITGKVLEALNASLPADAQVTEEDVEIGNVDWPADMPQVANVELAAAYFNAI